LRHRPIGLGLADAFIAFAFTGDEAKKLNQEIFETLYFAVTASMELAKLEGPYSTFEGSPTLRRISA
jgi:ribonucleoside-diphosphate reductase alpha chain